MDAKQNIFPSDPRLPSPQPTGKNDLLSSLLSLTIFKSLEVVSNPAPDRRICGDAMRRTLADTALAICEGGKDSEAGAAEDGYSHIAVLGRSRH